MSNGGNEFHRIAPMDSIWDTTPMATEIDMWDEIDSAERERLEAESAAGEGQREP